jgi:cytochrome b6-f complex iron-sulfur subunit
MSTRREFLATTVTAFAATTLTGCAVPSAPGSSIVGPPEVRIALPAIGLTVAANGVGQDGQGIAVTRLSATSVAAVSLQCTHQGCTLGLPAVPGADLVCPCHGAQFSVQGVAAPGQGLPALRTFVASIDVANNQVVIANS